MDAQNEYLVKVRDLVDSLKASLKKEDIDHIHHLIDHDEPQIAMTSLAFTIVNNDIKVTASVVARIKEFVSGSSEADQLPENLDNQIISD